MPLLTNPSFAARTAVIYVTVGALIDVWSGIWYAYMLHAPPQEYSTWYYCYGFLLTGLTLLIIGLAIGRIGRSAAARQFDPDAIELALRAHVRHRHTRYDELLAQGLDRADARASVRAAVDEVVERWRGAS